MLKKLKKKTKILLIITIIVIFWWFNNFVLFTKEYNYFTDKVSEDLRISVISDFHYEKIGISYEAVVKKVKNQKPDIICILGDMFSYKGKFDSREENAEKIVNMSQKLTEIAPVFAITGEHDYYDTEYFDNLRQVGVNVLWNESLDINVKGTQVCLFGIVNIGSNGDKKADKFSHPFSDKKLNILLAHEPVESLEDFNADLVFCGDSHGGVVRLPFYGGIYYKNQLFPKGKVSPIYDKGRFDFPNNVSTMYVTGGIGWYPFPVRLFNQPEVMLINVKKEV